MLPSARAIYLFAITHLILTVYSCDLFIYSKHYEGKELVDGSHPSCSSPLLDAPPILRCSVRCKGGDGSEESWICHAGSSWIFDNSGGSELKCNTTDPCAAQAKIPESGKNPPCDVPDGIAVKYSTTRLPSPSPTVQTLEEEEEKDWQSVLGLGLALAFSLVVYIVLFRCFQNQGQACRRRITILFELAIVILLGFFIMKEKELVKGFLMNTRSELKKLPTSVILSVYLVLQLIRFVVPPIYFCFPLDTLFKMVMLLKVSVYEGVLYWQSVTCLVSLVGYGILSQTYTGITDSVLTSKSYFEDLIAAISVVDTHWQMRFNTDGPGWQFLYITSFFNTEFFSSYIGLYWLATRAPIKEWNFPCLDRAIPTWAVFYISCIIGFALEFPAEVIQFHIIKGAIESYEKSEFEVFSDIQLYEVILYFIFTGVATTTIHYQNAKAVYNKVREKLMVCYDGTTGSPHDLEKGPSLTDMYCTEGPDLGSVPLDSMNSAAAAQV